MNLQKLIPIKDIILNNLSKNEFEWVDNLGSTFNAPSRSNDDIGILLKDADIHIKGKVNGIKFAITSKIIEVVYDESDQVLALKLADGTLCFSEDGITYTEAADEYSYDNIDVDDIRVVLAKD